MSETGNNPLHEFRRWAKSPGRARQGITSQEGGEGRSREDGQEDEDGFEGGDGLEDTGKEPRYTFRILSQNAFRSNVVFAQIGTIAGIGITRLRYRNYELNRASLKHSGSIPRRTSDKVACFHSRVL